MKKGIILGLSLALVLAGCGKQDTEFVEKEAIFGDSLPNASFTTQKTKEEPIVEEKVEAPVEETKEEVKGKEEKVIYPKYEYKGEDNLIKVLSSFTLEKFEDDSKGADITIPNAIVLDRVVEDDKVAVTGFFEIYGFKVEDNKLNAVYSLSTPGKIYLEENNNEYKIVDSKFAEISDFDNGEIKYNDDQLREIFGDINIAASPSKNITDEKLRKRIYEYMRDNEFIFDTFNIGNGDISIAENPELVTDMSEESTYSVSIKKDPNYKGDKVGVIMQKVDIVTSDNEELIKKYDLDPEEMFEYEIVPIGKEEKVEFEPSTPFYHYDFSDYSGFEGTTTTISVLTEYDFIYANIYLDDNGNISMIEEIYVP